MGILPMLFVLSLLIASAVADDCATCGALSNCSDTPPVPAGFFRCTCLPGTKLPGANAILFTSPTTPTPLSVAFPPELYTSASGSNTIVSWRSQYLLTEPVLSNSLSFYVTQDSWSTRVITGVSLEDIDMGSCPPAASGVTAESSCVGFTANTLTVSNFSVASVGNVTDGFSVNEVVLRVTLTVTPTVSLTAEWHQVVVQVTTTDVGIPVEVVLGYQPDADFWTAGMPTNRVLASTWTDGIDGSYVDYADGSTASDCVDINECVELPDVCRDIFTTIPAASATCADSTTNPDIPLGAFTCSCLSGYQVMGFPGKGTITYVVGDVAAQMFPGCDSGVCGDGVVGSTEECEPSLQPESCNLNCTCYGPGRHNVKDKVGRYFPAVPYEPAVGPPPAVWSAPFCNETLPTVSFCGDGVRDPIVEECDSSTDPGCTPQCLCNQGEGYFPFGTSATCGQHKHRHYAIGDPSTFGFFFHTTYCNAMSYERRLTRWPWVTLGDLECLADPLDLGYMGLRTFPDGDWDGLRDMTNAVSWNDATNHSFGVVNGPLFCNDSRTWDIATITVNPEARPLTFPGSSQLNTRFWWEAMDLAHTVKVRSTWDCETLAANNTCRRIFSVSPLKTSLFDLRIQLAFSHDINALHDSQIKMGVSTASNSTLLSYAAVREIRRDELQGSESNLQITPFLHGSNESDVCYPLANFSYDWSYKVGGPFHCEDGASVQLRFDGELKVGDLATVTTDLIVFSDSTAADVALQAQNPLFYEMVSYNPDPSLAASLPAVDSRVVATFTGPLVICSLEEAGDAGCPIPGDCPCQNGGTCENGSWGGNCTCASGWTGDLCEIKCPCQNGGTCDNSPATTCTCTGLWCGPLCETKSTCSETGIVDPLTCECFCQNGKIGKDCTRDVKCFDARQSETSVKAPQ